MNKINNYITALESVIKPRDIKGSRVELRDYTDLLGQGYISSPMEAITDMDDNTSIHQASITPKGALALAQWKDYMSEKSIWGQSKKTLGRLFWLLIGASLPLFIKLFESLL
ncbi:hypothetical protein GCM10011365_03760 [Marinicella pacifica]|uniref:Uncharacterized protein n=1 Tax=Marinicella pacifica TaxID=1171543 RepID=A0A917CEN1_9GAMM|nr:hypothetical protein [Marinicella pacifica]GGF85955.1 hypothetical protein GCM10011365_03760 [Marinicella pacifica]